MRLSRGAQRLLDLLRWYGSRFRRIHPTQEKLKAHLKVSVQTVRRWLLELKRLGAVLVRKCGPQSAEYELNKAAISQIDAEENERSVSGLRAVCERSDLNISLSAPHTVRVERKPPQREDRRFDRALELLLAEGYK